MYLINQRVVQRPHLQCKQTKRVFGTGVCFVMEEGGVFHSRLGVSTHERVLCLLSH